MSEIVLAKDAKPGHWHKDLQGCRYLCCGDLTFVSGDLEMISFRADVELITG